MPTAPPHACAVPGCPVRVPHGVRHCADHVREVRVEYDRRGGRTLLDSRRWRRLSAGFRRRHPLCAACLRDGLLVVADHVDHVVPHRGDLAAFWDPQNLQSLCRRCHASKTAAETLRGGRGADITGVEQTDGRWAVGRGYGQ
jgi:5-methylcytosine-specific restriction protein A